MKESIRNKKTRYGVHEGHAITDENMPEEQIESSNSAISASVHSEDVHRLTIGDREVILVGTAHVSQESVDLVRRVIAEEQPDCVCV